jgi:hypothetical protein
MMRALTLTQPWAGLVASGIKLIENRSWKPWISVINQCFAIHASREIDEDVYASIDEISPGLCRGHVIGGDKSIGDWWHLSRHTSAVIGVARLASFTTDLDGIRANEKWLPDQERWFFGPVGFMLADVRALTEPVPCRGAQGFWNLPEDVEQKVRAQL